MKQSDVQIFLDEYINPALASHGGFLKIIKYDKKAQHLHVEMGGGCQGCSASKHTLQMQVKTFLMEEFPDLKDIIDVTDHSAGENPYYRPVDETE